MKGRRSSWNGQVRMCGRPGGERAQLERRSESPTGQPWPFQDLGCTGAADMKQEGRNWEEEE